MRRIEQKDPRPVLFIVGALFIVASFCYYASRDVEPFFPWLWPTWMGVAGWSCIAFALWPANAALWQIGRILTVIGVLSRAASIFLRAADGTLPSTGAGLGGVCIYVVGAYALYRLWDTDLRIWSQQAAASKS